MRYASCAALPSQALCAVADARRLMHSRSIVRWRPAGARTMADNPPMTVPCAAGALQTHPASVAVGPREFKMAGRGGGPSSTAARNAPQLRDGRA